MSKRKIKMLPKTTYGLRSKAEKWHVDKLPKNKVEDRELLILGTGRCGTSMLSRMFQAVGLDVRHEKVGEFGTVSLFFNVDSEWYPMNPWSKSSVHVGERRSDFRFKHVWHVVRDPYKVIPSMTGIFPALNYEFFVDNGIIKPGIKPALLKCAHVYYELNKLAEKQASFRFKVEDMSEALWHKMLRKLGQKRCHMPVVSRGQATGFRKRDPITWKDLDALDPELTSNILDMAVRYGY